MKLYCLSGHSNKPCFILKFKTTTMMLDCGLDITTLLHYLPLPLTPSGKFSRLSSWSPRELAGAAKLDHELKEVGGKIFIDSEPEFAVPELGVIDLSEVDVLLLSNYNCMLALPFITEYTGFKGTVYATEPTLHIGREYMKELVEYVQRVPKHSRATKWKAPNVLNFLPPPLKDAISPYTWKKCYNLHDIHASIAKVQMVGFNQKVDIFGALQATAVSSGFCLGSSNWIIQSDHEKIAYVSGSSTLTTHPKPMDQAPLKNSDVLLMCGLTQTPTCNPDAMIGEFCVNTAVTLKNGGNVLVPCYPSGVTYDLFECLSGHLESCGLAQVPLYFVSPVSDSSLAYSNIYAEWVCTSKQNKVYLPEPPFPHAELVANNRLHHFSSIHDGFSSEMRNPCVVFVGHPSLRFGDVVHFIELWGKTNSNTIIFTEPDYPYLEALAPFQPLAMKVAYCPIDTSLSFAQANKLIKELKPSHLVVPEQYTAPPILWPHRTDLVIDAEPSPQTFKRAEVISLPIKRRYEKVEMDAQLAAGLIPNEVKPGVAVAMVSGSLLTKDNKYLLQPFSTEPNSKKSKTETKRPSYVWGALDVEKFAGNLRQLGIGEVTVEEAPTGHIVHLPSEDTLIQIEDGSTHIICQGNEELRMKLRDTLLKCLAKF